MYLEISVKNISTKNVLNLRWGCSGLAAPELQKAAGGLRTNNIKLIITIEPGPEEAKNEEDSQQKTGQLVSLGIMFDEGRQVAIKAFTGVATLRKITREEVEKILNDWDPIEAPPGEYKIQPEKQGKLKT